MNFDKFTDNIKQLYIYLNNILITSLETAYQYIDLQDQPSTSHQLIDKRM